jgi:hypothetical protein
MTGDDDDDEQFAMDFTEEDSFESAAEKLNLRPPELRVYLAGPLTNNDDAVKADCVAVRQVVKRLFHSYNYLGARFVVYDPADVTQPGSTHSAEQVYELDHARTTQADLVIFHVNVPSLGVGIESQIAADATVPRVTIARKGTKVSRMFAGIFSPSIADLTYGSVAELETVLSRHMLKIAKHAVKSAAVRRDLLASFGGENLGRTIMRQRILSGISIEQLAALTDIKESWLRRLERDPALMACVSLVQLVRIGHAVNCHPALSATSNLPTLKSHLSALPEHVDASLESLIEFVLSQRSWVPDEQLLGSWQTYTNGLKREEEEAISHRDEGKRAITAEQWGRLLGMSGLFGDINGA